MGAYKENQEEQKHRYEYAQDNFWLLVFVSFISAFIFVSVFYNDRPFMQYIFNFPNMDDLEYFIAGIGVILSLRWWWFGIPSYLMFFIKKIPSLYKAIPNDVIRGKRKTMDEFFFQSTIRSDEIPRVKELKFFSKGKYDISTLFNYNAETCMIDRNGTSRVISYFRDSKNERILNLSESRDSETSKKAKEILVKYNARHPEGGSNPTPPQEDKYLDLFQAIEGIIDGYGGILNKEIKSPLVLNLKKNKNSGVGFIVDGFFVDEKISVYEDGEVIFSIKMISDTTRNMTILFSQFLRGRLEAQSRIGGLLAKRIKTNREMEDFIQKSTDFFKLVFLRRLLLNYGSIPAGWLVVRIESYDLRAVISAIDRELIPTITSNNDGSNNTFQSDVFATNFLFTYWSFMKSDEMVGTIEKIDWSFNTVKDVTEIKMRKMVQEASQEKKKGTL